MSSEEDPHSVLETGSENDTAFGFSLCLLFPPVRFASVVPILRAWLMFPLEVTYLRQSLPHVIGSPVSKYYELI